LAINDFEELIAAGAFIAGQYFILFFPNYFGQKVTNCRFLMFNKV